MTVLPQAVVGRRPIPAAVGALVGAALCRGERCDDLEDAVGPAVGLGLLWPDGSDTLAVWGHRRRWRARAGARASLRAVPPVERVPAGLATCFDLASLTKPMATVTLWAQALSAPADRPDLATRLGTWLPDARGAAIAEASLAQALGHASGVPAWRDFAADHPDDPAALRRAVLATPAERAPGERAVYSDLGYMALGWALEARGGGALDALFDRAIGGPMGLSAHFRRVHGPPPRRVATVATECWRRPGRNASAVIDGAVHDDNAWALGGVAGHAGLFACVGDVTAWARGWITSVAAGARGPLGLDPGIARALTSTAAAPETTWRLGWDTPSPGGSTAGDAAGSDAFGHLGFTGTSVWLDPARRAGVVLLTARVHPTREATGGIRALRPALHDAAWAAFDATS